MPSDASPTTSAIADSTSSAYVAQLPKVVLHDHLDGGLRPATIVEIAAEIGHELPATDPDALGAWFVEAATSGSLPLYLETFDHTIAVMQTAEHLRRVARESVLDLAADGVVYAEQRWAPEQHLQQGLTLQQAVDAVREGLAEGAAQVAEQGGVIWVGQLVTAMRHADRWAEIAELALANRVDGPLADNPGAVVGFDIAGAELGFPPSRFPETWSTLAEASFPTTIHAGEADGLASISEAVHLGRASRIGHGVRIVDDIDFADDGAHDPVTLEPVARLGRLAHWVRDHQVPLELCPSSNVQTGGAASIAEHPITRLLELEFAVTVNTDNRLQSGTSMTREMTLLADEAGWQIEDFAEVTMNAAWNAFVHHDERRRLVDEIIAPRYAEIEGAQL
ncbi:adenosine deaminase [Luteimicrobium subarcticum]|uniref:adenosine deaminase n=1 Tax=Luteimicrobium subarcticum TaxID=620910 RepID=A0A2M8WUH3_9MICO|nr:adenosine deaminase [Luteimicrobium subarcticum]PJI94582.1 adenosine deaminase [Luteimicrobium subarcticum]